MFQIFTILFQTYVFAATIPVNEAELLKATGLEKSYISKETGDSLESLLFYSNNGITCGLEEFYIDGYNITDALAEKLTRCFGERPLHPKGVPTSE